MRQYWPQCHPVSLLATCPLLLPSCYLLLLYAFYCLFHIGCVQLLTSCQLLLSAWIDLPASVYLFQSVCFGLPASVRLVLVACPCMLPANCFLLPASGYLPPVSSSYLLPALSSYACLFMLSFAACIPLAIAFLFACFTAMFMHH